MKEGTHMATEACPDAKVETCPWDPVTYPSWADEVLKQSGGWKSIVVQGEVQTYVLQGPCPRCHHADGISEWVPAHVHMGIVPLKEMPREIVTCKCGAAHDATGKKTGCGQADYVAIIIANGADQ
jgi:hypothetical protein